MSDTSSLPPWQVVQQLSEQLKKQGRAYQVEAGRIVQSEAARAEFVGRSIQALNDADDLDAILTTIGTTSAEIPNIDCPLCGINVRQVASATLSLALWQHVNWACRSAPPGESVSWRSPRSK